MAKRKLIVIEGSDGSGKETQAKLALAALNTDNRVTYLDFPRYGISAAGDIVGRSLKGDFGDFLKLDPHLAALPYTLDRVGAKADIERAMSNGVVLCNRYVGSNAAHQGAKCPPEEQDKFVVWLEHLEYEEFGLPEPDLVLFLHVPFAHSQKLIREKGERAYLGSTRSLDVHELSEPYQKRVIDLYLRMACARDDWAVVECVRDDELLSVDQIHQMVMEQIWPIL